MRRFRFNDFVMCQGWTRFNLSGQEKGLIVYCESREKPLNRKAFPLKTPGILKKRKRCYQNVQNSLGKWRLFLKVPLSKTHSTPWSQASGTTLVMRGFESTFMSLCFLGKLFNTYLWFSKDSIIKTKQNRPFGFFRHIRYL